MVYNNTYWVNDSVPINYGDYVDYQIVNTSDSHGNFLQNPSEVHNHTFNYDTKAPEMLSSIKYYFRNDDSFKVNITNTWGEGIDTVIVNGTNASLLSPDWKVAVMSNYANFAGNVQGYINETLSPANWGSGDIINFTIFVNDTIGNYYISNYYEGYKYSNTPPSAENLTYSPVPLYSNGTLYFQYDWSDPDLYQNEGESEIRWYRNSGSVFQLAPFLNDSKQIPTEYLLKGDEWYATVRPKDGEIFGSLVNESSEPGGIIIVQNTPPSLIDFSWQQNYFYTIDDLGFIFTFVDDDPADIEITNDRIVNWYLNGSHVPQFDNYNMIPSLNSSKGQKWFAQIRISDGTNYSNNFYYLPNTTIRNSPPQAELVTIVPINPYTNQNLNATWDYFDFDVDPQVINQSIIIWYKNGVPQPNYYNKSVVLASETSRGEIWYFECWVTDGYNYSKDNYWSDFITIINSPPQVSNIQINSGSPKIYTTDDLEVSWDFSDLDPSDVEVLSDALILWYLHGINQSFFTNETTIPTSYIFKGQKWDVEVAVKDNGGLWSSLGNSSIITISNSLPEISLQINNHPEFIVEDQDLVIGNTYYLFTDADGDNDQSLVQWFRNGTYQPEYDNKSVLASVTSPGEVWNYVITPYDEEDLGINRTSPVIVIESRPVINSYNFIPMNDTEGHYKLVINAIDSRNEIEQVEFRLYLNSTDELPLFAITSPDSESPDIWILDYFLSDYSYLNTITIVNITVVTQVIYSGENINIELTKSYNITIMDIAPPRVIEVELYKDDEQNPTSLTFNAEVEEFGSGVAEVVLYYYFRPVNNSNGSGGVGANELQWVEDSMTLESTTVSYSYWSVNVDFPDFNYDVEIIYRINTRDNDGNENPIAFDITEYPQRIRDQRFIYIPPGLPAWLLLLAGLVVVVVFIGSIVYVRFIRKPELVGLDKELVMKNIENISETQISGSLDSHTIGVVVSFFDQAQGPIPIIVIPEILKDNFSKLIELSDRSFSGTGFADTFEVEIPSSYDFVLDQGVRISAMSFGFSLERPQARGGQENLTVNILIHQDVFPLLNQFQDEVKTQVHELHMLMNDPATSGDKNLIHAKVFGLRKYISMIALAYQELYGTTDLLSEEDE